MNKGEYKISVLYPNNENNTFNLDYYCAIHIPLVKKLFGDALLHITVEKGVSGATPDSTPSFKIITNLYFESTEAYENALEPIREQLQNDLAKFTNIYPIVQISEVVI